jgi:hypothetical protein
MGVISQAERSNFLRQCWRTGRWGDGVGTLLLPLRMSLYGMRKEARRPRSWPATPVRFPQREEAPEFSKDVLPVFCENASIELADAGLQLPGLFAEVDAQIQGVCRLAGGHAVQLDVANLEALDDAEDHHAYHRLYWALRYAIAAAYGHERAAQALADELSRWMDGRWNDSAVAAWPYTVAERIASLTSVLFWIARGNSPALSSLVVPVKRQVWQDARRLSTAIEYGLGVHNHLLNDARGLFLAGAALADCRQAASWQEQAFQIWGEYFPRLVLEDGAFAEQSSHYHVLLCRTALEYWLACRRFRRALPAGFESRIESMFRLANELFRQDGSLPRFGDNSPDRTGQDLWGLLPAAFFYGLLKQPPRHNAVTPLTIFYCGASPDLPGCQPARASVVFPKGGFAILRSASLNAEVVAHGDARESVGPHGDAGRGSYELWWNGDVLIREPGSFFSNTDASSRFYQCGEAQNVTSLDGLAPVITKQDARFLARWYWPEGGVWKSLPGVGAEFRCEAFRRLHPGIVLFRSWRFTDECTLEFEERIEGASRVRFESRICLGDASWKPASSSQPDVRDLVWTSPSGSAARMRVTAPQGIAGEIAPCHFLPDYGIEKSGRVLLLKGVQKLPFSWTIQWKFTPGANGVASIHSLSQIGRTSPCAA